MFTAFLISYLIGGIIISSIFFLNRDEIEPLPEAIKIVKRLGTYEKMILFIGVLWPILITFGIYLKLKSKD